MTDITNYGPLIAVNNLCSFMTHYNTPLCCLMCVIENVVVCILSHDVQQRPCAVSMDCVFSFNL